MLPNQNGCLLRDPYPLISPVKIKIIFNVFKKREIVFITNKQVEETVTHIQDGVAAIKYTLLPKTTHKPDKIYETKVS